MKKIALATAIALLTYSTYAQVGIGNTNPNATLDISATNTGTPANTDGILIPRVDEFPTTNPTAAQDAMMIFVTGSGTATRGFYYWNHGATSWVVVGSDTGVQKIDDLTDGKSDSDGTDDGSSIFIGVDAGAADDSSSNANVGIGYTALEATIGGRLNTALGWGSLRANLGSSNTAIGYLSGSGITTGVGNTVLGRNSLVSNTVGNYNTALGFYAGTSNTGSGNLFLGANAGFNHTTASNVMYIDNTGAGSSAALIYGEFGADATTTGNILRTNSEFQIGNPTGTGYAFPTIDGTNGQVLTSNGAGALGFHDVSSLAATSASNGLTYNSGDIKLGGSLSETTTVNLGSNLMVFNMNSGGDFHINNTGIGGTQVAVDSNGFNYFANGIVVNENTTSGDGVAFLSETGGAGNLILYDNTGVVQHSIRAGGNVIFNENSLSFDFRIESNSDENSFFLDGGSGRLGLGTNLPSTDLHIVGEVRMEDLTGTNNRLMTASSTGVLATIADGTAGQFLTTDGSGNLSFSTLSANNWSLTGNAGTNSTTNFIGTTDNQALSIRVNNSNKLRVTNKGQIEVFNTASSVYIGELAGANYTLSSAFNNVGIGHSALTTNSSGSNNTAIGSHSMEDNTTGYQNVGVGFFTLSSNTTGRDNVALGNFAMPANTFGVNNVALGSNSMSSNTSGSNNLSMGYNSLRENTLGNGNIGIGGAAGYSNISGDYNVFLGFNAGYNETGDHKLYIENTNADANNALLYGEFDNDILRTNGTLQIGNPTTTGFAFPTADGTSGQIIETDGSGTLSWVNPASFTDTDDQTIDNLGLSGDNLGISLEDDGQPIQTVDLSSVSYNVTNFALAKMTMSALQVHPISSWTKQNFDGTTIDIGSNFDTATDRFDVTEAGQYKISASYRSTTTIATNNLFGISIYVNGAAVRTEIINHYASGALVRKVNTLESLAVGDYIEIYFFANAALTINNSTLYTSFEVERIR